jgi:hypothetical protein
VHPETNTPDDTENTHTMEQTTLRLPADLLEDLDEEAEEHGVSRSEYVRDILASRHEHERLRTEVERLRNEKRTVLEQREEHQELVAFARTERELVERREQREREREAAGVMTRAKWWVFGRDVDESK